MNNIHWLLVPSSLPSPEGSDARSHALAILASASKGADIRLVLANAVEILFDELPEDIESFSFEGARFDRSRKAQPRRLSLDDKAPEVGLSAWRRHLNARIDMPPLDWPYSNKLLASWRVVLSCMDILKAEKMQLRVCNQLLGCLISKD